jgi:hypothetical protein
VLLPTLAFIGLVTFERVLQSGIEDIGYARRIARLRGDYFDAAPELTPYLLSVPSVERLSVQGLGARRGQRLRTVAGMVAVITAVLAGCVVGVLVAALSDGSVAAALAAGVAVGAIALAVLMKFQRVIWRRAVGRGCSRTTTDRSDQIASGFRTPGATCSSRPRARPRSRTMSLAVPVGHNL